MDEWIRKINMNGIEYFKNKYTGEKIFRKDLDLYTESQSYAPTEESLSYIIINTIDGQVRIPDDALFLLKKWSRIINVSWSQETDRTINVSSSYLTRLISISRACIQYISLEGGDNELVDKKRDQINAMFGAHTRKEFTSFYDEVMELTSELAEFMESIGISETKSVVKSSNVWAISPGVSQMLLGTIVDPLDPTFTISQYITIAALSYLEHLKKTKPHEVEGLVVSPTLLLPNSSILDEAGNRITTWFPVHIMIKDVKIVLAREISGNRIANFTMDHVMQRMTSEMQTYFRRDEEVSSFINGLFLIIRSCMDPSSRVFKSA